MIAQIQHRERERESEIDLQIIMIKTQHKPQTLTHAIITIENLNLKFVCI